MPGKVQMFPHPSFRARPNREGFDMDSITTPTTGNRTEFSDLDASEMIVEGVSGMDNFGIKFANTYREFANSDAPAVALAILTAAGVEAADPMNSDNDLFSDNVGDKYAVLWLKKFIEQQTTKALKADAEKELTRRRDELALDLFDQPAYVNHPDVITYTDCTPVVRTAIDMIIQLQGEATK